VICHPDLQSIASGLKLHQANLGPTAEIQVEPLSRLCYRGRLVLFVESVVGFDDKVATSETLVSVHSDSSLLTRVQSGDEEAMASLYDSYSTIVYSVALRVLRDPCAAEDVLQDVFLRIWRRPCSFIAARGSLSGWLAIIARNRAIDVLRQRKPVDSVDDVQLQSSSDITADVEHSVMIERIRSLLLELPLTQRHALEMAFFKGWTHAEIAKSEQIPLGTVKTRIRTALLALGTAVRSKI
jgi:RNA polymerase sigma-70 factor (ECF subfamily)